MKNPLVLIIAAALCLPSCQEPSSTVQNTEKVPLTPVDSLYEEVMLVHDQVMPKMGKIRGAQQRAQQQLDSLVKKGGAASAAYRQQLQQLVSDLSYADFAMDKWMTEFNLDSARQDPSLRMTYLKSEYDKVSKVKQAILQSLSSADSLMGR